MPQRSFALRPTCVIVGCSIIFAILPALLLAESPPDTDNAEAVEAGHSQHGEAFNEGPRQAAYLMGETGPIHFEVTSDHSDVQKFVEQGIGQLHGFWYFEAERSFRQASMLDPDCAICYWGMAMANAYNSTRAKKFLEEAQERRGLATEREAMYIDQLDDELNGKGDKKEKAKRYIAAWEAIVARYPDDLEAKAWLAYAMYKNRSSAGKKYEEVDASIQAVLDVQPLHPVHHYRIHLWDVKDAKKALASASLAGKSASDIAHMWHMPGHIYSRLKRYEDAAWQQEASARTDHRNMMRDRVLPDEIHNFAHNNEWLIRDLIYVGRWQDAVDLAKNMIELPRHPKYNTLSRRKSSYYGRVRLFETLKRYERWSDIIALTDTPYLEPTDDAEEQERRLEYRGIAFAHLHHVDKVMEVLAELNERLEPQQLKAAEDKQKAEDAKRQADAKKEKPPAKKTSPAETAVKRLEKAIASIEGRLLVEYGDYQQALPALNKAGDDKFYIAKIQLLAGEKEAALKAIEAEIKSRENQVHPLAVQIEMLWLAGEKEQAKAAFEKLRALSSSIQLGAAPFDRLTPIATALGLPEDWRIARMPSKDFGERPELDSLGPFRWSPTAAPGWTLKDHTGKDHSLADYHGKPVVVIFYLGAACLHCAEQLQAFAPKVNEFQKAGISLIAISTDDHSKLKTSVEDYGETMPIPLVSNASLDIFKAYRAYDDFEQVPLHGTFLIDGNGKVLWQDIGYEPFNDVKFVLKESQRLLHQSKPLPEALAVSELPIRRPPLAASQANLPRIDPIGIAGSLVLSGSELPDAAINTFIHLAGADAAKAVVLSLDNEDATKATTQRMLASWNDSPSAELNFVRVGNDKQLAEQDWANLLADATGVWIAGSDVARFTALTTSEPARTALAKFMADGKVIGTAGAGSEMLAAQGFRGEKSNDFQPCELALLPDAIVDTHSSGQESVSRLATVVEQRAHLIGFELDAGAAMVVRGRRIWKVGDGAVRIARRGDTSDAPIQLTLSGERDAADLTALRRAARDAMKTEISQAKPPAAKVDNGTLIIIGGGGMPAGIIPRFVELAGGNASHIVVLPTAMPDPISDRPGIDEEFRKAGAKTVTVLRDRTLDKVESAEYTKALEQATGIWFGGGRQWRFVDAYLDTKAETLMHDVLRRGGVIMGSSAGASIQAEYLARGDPLNNTAIMADGYERGLGFLPGVAIDQHFSQRRRQDDMLSLVKRYPQWLGIGIDESTALIVSGEVGEIVGRGDVYFYDAKSASGEEIQPAVISDGGRYDMTRREAIRPPQPGS